MSPPAPLVRRCSGPMKPYSRNVGIVVFNSHGKVLAGERTGHPGAFQFPQGGIDPDERPLEAAYRELFEEIGLRLANPPVFETDYWLRYDFPPSIPAHLKKYRGQEQKWFFFHWDGDLASLALDHHQREFDRVAWMDFEAVVQAIVSFKQDIYRELMRMARKVIPAHIARTGGAAST